LGIGPEFKTITTIITIIIFISHYAKHLNPLSHKVLTKCLNYRCYFIILITEEEFRL
jgi:hypothetical protein